MSSLTTAEFVPTCQTVPLDQSPEHFGLMRDSSDAVQNAAVLNRRLQEEGYVYLPGALGRDRVLAARREMTARLAAEGKLAVGTDPMDAIVASGDTTKFHPDLARGNAALHEVLYSGAMIDIFRRILDGPVRHFDFTWVRCVSPGPATPIHSDVVYMGRGTHRLYTAWTPLGDTPPEMGGLIMLEGSNHHDGLAKGYWQSDVDSYCTNRPGQKDGWSKTGGYLNGTANRIRQSLGGRWLTADYRAGDVVIFSVYTVHGGTDNHTNRFRLSTDTRYQHASDPVDERWIGENPIGHSQAGKRGRVC